MVADILMRSKRPTPQSLRVLENGFLQSSFSGYVTMWDSTRLHRIVSGRDSNSYSFRKNYGYIPGCVVSEWFSHIKDKATSKDFVVGAATTADQFTQVYFRKPGPRRIRMRVTCQLDGVVIKPGQSMSSEKIFLSFGSGESTQRRFAESIRANMSVQPLKKNISGLNCSYYSIGNYVDEKIVLEELSFLHKNKKDIPVDYIQLDAGYSPWGDWLYCDKNFPRRFKWLVEQIEGKGFRAGIWISPFTATKKTRVYKDHKGWFLKNKRGKPKSARRTYPFDFFFGFFGSLDPSNPEVLEYLRETVHTMVHVYGFRLIKLDFLYACLTSVNYYDENATRVQAIRKGLKTIREAAGEDVYLMSAISPLSPLVGYIDIARISVDVVSPQVYKLPFIRRAVNKALFLVTMRNMKARGFLNGVIWRNDPDIMVANPKSGLSNKETKRLMNEIKDYGGPVILGDSLVGLPKDRLKKYIYPLFK